MPGLQLSNAVAEALEDALTEAHEHAPPPAFFARLYGIAQSHAADGQVWRERQLSEGRGRELAEATRCLAALSACGGVLLAAQSARETDDAQAQCVRTAAVEPSRCSAARRSWHRWDSWPPRGGRPPGGGEGPDAWQQLTVVWAAE